mgnify:CR=1 FL=1
MDLRSVRRLKAQIEEKRAIFRNIERAGSVDFSVGRLKIDSAAAQLATEIMASVTVARSRQVMILRYVACMHFSEICEALKLSPARIYALHSDGAKQFSKERENDKNRN